jgi:hypothetical protein
MIEKNMKMCFRDYVKSIDDLSYISQFGVVDGEPDLLAS